MIGTGLSAIWCFVPLMLATIYFDLRHLRLPNFISLALLAAFVAWAPFALEMPDALWRCAIATLIFGLGFAAFAAGLLGGGDVKVLGAVVLFIPLQGLAFYFFFFGACLLLGTGAVLLLRKMPGAAQSDWKVLSATGRFPMGLAIGAAGLIFAALYGGPAFRIN